MDFKLIYDKKDYVKSIEVKMNPVEALIFNYCLSDSRYRKNIHESDKRIIERMLSDIKKGMEESVQSKKD